MVKGGLSQKQRQLKTKLKELRNSLLQGLVEREEAMRLVLLAALAGEHALLIGPPGTAKSEMARRLHLAFNLEDGKSGYFERLLTRFTVPEELFGPLSIAALEKDIYERKTERYLPNASIAFIDEIFKANSAILNALLTLLNEREFDNGTERVKTPLISVVGASNELPKETELAALYDRFLMRYRVTSVSHDSFNQLLGLRGSRQPNVKQDLTLTLKDLQSIKQQSEKVRVPENVMVLLGALRKFAGEQGIEISDRRMRKIQSLLQTSAFTDGRNEVSIWDCWLVQHCAWQKPEQRQVVQEWYHKRLGTLTPSEPEHFAKLTAAWEKRLEHDRNSKIQAKNKDGQPLFTDSDGKQTTEVKSKTHDKNSQGELLYSAPKDSGYDRTNDNKGYTKADLEELSYFSYNEDVDKYCNNSGNWFMSMKENRPVMITYRFSRHHIKGFVEQVDTNVVEVTDHITGLERELASLRVVIDDHLWIPKGFSTIALTNLQETCDKAKGIKKRLEAVRDGFSTLPLEEG